MNSTLVIYYSQKGSNRYLAQRIANDLNCLIEELKPRVNAHLLFIMGIHFGNKKIKNNIAQYEQIILVGPIWVGKFIPPLKSFVKKHQSKIKKLIFVTCCGSSFEDKEKKFGHALVFKQVADIFPKPLHCEAFPITMVVPKDKLEDANEVMQTRLSDSNFKGEILELYEKFVQQIKEDKL